MRKIKTKNKHFESKSINESYRDQDYDGDAPDYDDENEEDYSYPAYTSQEQDVLRKLEFDQTVDCSWRYYADYRTYELIDLTKRKDDEDDNIFYETAIHLNSKDSIIRFKSNNNENLKDFAVRCLAIFHNKKKPKRANESYRDQDYDGDAPDYDDENEQEITPPFNQMEEEVLRKNNFHKFVHYSWEYYHLRNLRIDVEKLDDSSYFGRIMMTGKDIIRIHSNKNESIESFIKRCFKIGNINESSVKSFDDFINESSNYNKMSTRELFDCLRDFRIKLTPEVFEKYPNLEKNNLWFAGFENNKILVFFEKKSDYPRLFDFGDVDFTDFNNFYKFYVKYMEVNLLRSNNNDGSFNKSVYKFKKYYDSI